MRKKLVKTIFATHKQHFLVLLMIVFCLGNSFAQEMQPIGKDFYIKPVHSFGFQYNACIVPKAKFSNQNPINEGWDPLVSYRNEIIIRYNFSSASGFGFTFEALQGTTSYRYKVRNNSFSDRRGSEDIRGLLVPLVYDYMGFNIKFSYIKQITPFLFIQLEIGLKLPYYIHGIMEKEHVSYSTEDSIVSMSYMEYDNDNCPRKFFPDLTTGANFLFHTKHNPRNNFLIGFNVNIGFVPRYTGYYSITPPFGKEQKDCDIRIGSTHFGFNFGYEFMGFKKPLHRIKVYRKEQPFEDFDFSKPIHSFGLIVSMGTSFPSRMKNKAGAISPKSPAAILPEATLRYSVAIFKGWGLASEFSLSSFQRVSTYSLRQHIDPDTVWSNGAVGAGETSFRGIRTRCFGFALKASYLAKIHKRMFIQSELGVKFVFIPFINDLEKWTTPEDYEIPYTDTAGYATDIIWMRDAYTVKRAYHGVPDLTFTINFMLHGKNPNHNFIFGINANLCFVDRIGFSYQTTDELPAHLQSSGRYGWRTSSIAFHVGYQFMKGKIGEYSK